MRSVSNIAIGRQLVKRTQKGSILAIASVCILILATIGVLLFTGFQMLMLNRQQAQYAVQSAAMTAASSLSRIVIKSPRWGYVSLSDHPACGTGAQAPDGESLPVYGYNTVTGTVRMETLIAEKTNASALGDLADKDYDDYQKIKTDLQSALDKAVSAPNRSGARVEAFADMDGDRVDVYQCALAAFQSNMPALKSGALRLKSFSLSLGWLDGSSMTVTPNPERAPATASNTYNPHSAKFIDLDEAPDRCYPSFKNVPVNSQDFYFAGVSDQVRLVDAARFHKEDGKRLSSCVLVTASFELPTSNDKTPITVCAAALPYAEHCYAAPGTLAISLPQGGVRQTASLNSLKFN